MRSEVQSDCRLLAVYGSLRRDVAGREHPLMAPADFVDTGHFSGCLYDLGEFPGAIQADSGTVAVEIFRLLDPDTAWLRLDDYEDCHAEDPYGGMFHRAVLQVERSSGPPLSAWVYLYNKPVTESLRVISGIWVAPR